MKTIFKVISFFYVLVILNSCCPECDEKELPTFNDQGEICSQGGIVKTDDGASVTIPSGALSTCKTISIINSTKTYTIENSGCRIYELKPDGQTFSDSIIITLPFDDKYINLNSTEKNYGVKVLVFKDSSWVNLSATVDFANKTISAKTNHFSFYVVAAPAVFGYYFQNNKSSSTHIYNVPYYYQGNLPWCAYYSLSMITKYSGYYHKAPFFASLLNESPTSGFGPVEFVSLNNNLNNSSISTEIATPWAIIENLEGYILQQLDNGFPVWVGSINLSHAFVVVGHDYSSFYINDPSGAFVNLIYPSLSRDHLALVDVSYTEFANLISKLGCEYTIVIKSEVLPNKLAGTLNFPEGYSGIYLTDQNSSMVTGSLEFDGKFKPNGYSLINSSNKNTNFNGSDFISIMPVVSNSDRADDLVANLHYKIDNIDVTGSPVIITVPKLITYLQAKSLKFQLRNIAKGNHTLSVELRAANNPNTRLDYWDIPITIANEFSLPRLTANSITSIIQTSAIGGGNSISDGGSPVISKGVCWSTTQNPTIENSKTNDGTGPGDFTSNLYGLTPNTTYWVRAYATNAVGTAYSSNQPTFITLGNSPVAAFTASQTVIKAGQSIQFTDQSTNTPTTWSWSFGDGGTGTIKNPSHIFTSAGTYTVTLTVTNSFGNNTLTKTNYITVNPAGNAPVAAFTASQTVITAGQSIQFTDQSTNNPTSWSWNFGDGGTSTSQNPAHTYSTAGTYTVTLTAANSTGSNGATRNGYITVNTPVLRPVAAFTGSPITITAGQSVQFTDLSTNNPTSWSWNFGDGGTSIVQNPIHQYSAAGTYTISLTATNISGSDPEIKDNYISVNPIVSAPISDFSAGSTITQLGYSTRFNDQSANNPTSWAWDFGDGATSTNQNPYHAYQHNGNYTVSLKVNNSAGSDTKTVSNYISVVLDKGNGVVFNSNLKYGYIWTDNEQLYYTIQIGTQTWMAENLREWTLNDGTQIPEITDNSSLNTPAYYYYNNDYSNSDIYGYLYNWYAVNTGLLCPAGWHVATGEEWQILYYPFDVGLGNVAGAELMEQGTTHWNRSDITGTDEIGFTALPAGIFSGSFNDVSQRSMYWEYGETQYSYDAFYYPIPIPGTYGSTPLTLLRGKDNGLSVRCLKDN